MSVCVCVEEASDGRDNGRHSNKHLCDYGKSKSAATMIWEWREKCLRRGSSRVGGEEREEEEFQDGCVC